MDRNQVPIDNYKLKLSPNAKTVHDPSASYMSDNNYSRHETADSTNKSDQNRLAGNNHSKVTTGLRQRQVYVDLILPDTSRIRIKVRMDVQILIENFENVFRHKV